MVGNIRQGQHASDKASPFLACDVGQWHVFSTKECKHISDLCVSRKRCRSMACDIRRVLHARTRHMLIVENYVVQRHAQSSKVWTHKPWCVHICWAIWVMVWAHRLGDLWYCLHILAKGQWPTARRKCKALQASFMAYRHWLATSVVACAHWLWDIWIE